MAKLCSDVITELYKLIDLILVEILVDTRRRRLGDAFILEITNDSLFVFISQTA